MGHGSTGVLSRLTRRRHLAAMVAIAGSVSSRWVRAASPWPAHALRLVTPFSAGGPGDEFARAASDALAKAFGQAVIVDNRPGAGGIIGADVVSKAAPDGYTLLAGANGTLINGLIRPTLPYAPASLVPVVGVSSSPTIIVVRRDSPATSFKSLQTLAKADPNGLLFATTGTGSTSHFTGEMMKAAFGVKLTMVPYKSGAESLQALLSGQVQLVADVPSSTLVALVKAGKLRALAVGSDRRLPALPDIQSTAELGFGSVRMTHWLGLFAPKGTPAEILDRIAAAVQSFINADATRKDFAARNAEPFTGDRAAFTRFVDSETVRLGKIATDLHIVAE